MIADYTSFKKHIDPEEWRILRKWEEDPSMMSGKEQLQAFYRLIGMDDVEFEDIFNFD